MKTVPPELLTAREVAAILKVPRQRVYALKERIGYVLLSEGTIRFRAADVYAFIEARTRAPAAAPNMPGPAPRAGPSSFRGPAARPVSRRAAEIRERLRSPAPRGKR